MAIRYSFADMSKFTTQSYYGTEVKLLHSSITHTPIIDLHNTIQGSEKVLICIKVTPSVYSAIVQRDLWKSITKSVTFIVSQLIGNSIRISLPVIRISTFA